MTHTKIHKENVGLVIDFSFNDFFSWFLLLEFNPYKPCIKRWLVLNSINCVGTSCFFSSLDAELKPICLVFWFYKYISWALTYSIKGKETIVFVIYLFSILLALSFCFFMFHGSQKRKQETKTSLIFYYRN